LKQVVIEPLIAALRSEMREALRPLMDQLADLSQREHKRDKRIDQIEQRLSHVERFKFKLVTICSSIALVVGVVWHIFIDWARNRISKSH
jgi:hypothetical protein